jgi:hypothetical protein
LIVREGRGQAPFIFLLPNLCFIIGCYFILFIYTQLKQETLVRHYTRSTLLGPIRTGSVLIGSVPTGSVLTGSVWTSVRISVRTGSVPTSSVLTGSVRTSVRTGSVRTDSLLYALLSVSLLIQESYLAYQIIPSTVS